jgi:glutathione peroxidase
MENIYDFEVQKSNGENYKLDVYKGDVMQFNIVLVVSL